MYCPIKRYPVYIGSNVVSADNNCPSVDAINAAIAAQVIEFSNGDCQSFDCAFGGGGGSASLGANGQAGSLMDMLLGATDS
jgi:hypothetical protein